MSGIAGKSIVTDGLVLHLDTANNKSYPGSGTVITDLSGNVINGTLVNGPIFNSGNAGTIAFDGTNDYVEMDRDTNYDFVRTDSFTVSGWLNITQADANAAILGKWGSNGSSTGGYMIWAGASGNNNLVFSVASGAAAAASTFKITHTFGTWNYIVGIYYSNTKLEIYKNGTLSQTANYTGDINNPAVNFRIGKADYGTQTFTGKSSIVTVHNKALTVEEILQNYNATKARFGL